MILQEQLRLKAENKRLTEEVSRLASQIVELKFLDDSAEVKKESGVFGKIADAFRKGDDEG